MNKSARLADGAVVLKIEKLSHIMGDRGSQDLRSPYLIMVPGTRHSKIYKICQKHKLSNFASNNSRFEKSIEYQ